MPGVYLAGGYYGTASQIAYGSLVPAPAHLCRRRQQHCIYTQSSTENTYHRVLPRTYIRTQSSAENIRTEFRRRAHTRRVPPSNYTQSTAEHIHTQSSAKQIHTHSFAENIPHTHRVPPSKYTQSSAEQLHTARVPPSKYTQSLLRMGYIISTLKRASAPLEVCRGSVLSYYGRK